MNRFMLKSKIHRLKVTEANVEYNGSLTLDLDLMDKANLVPFERVSVYNVSNGKRFDTYLIEGKAGSGVVCVNGAAAHLAQPGDLLILASYTWINEENLTGYFPVIVFVDEENKILETDTKI